MRALWLACAFVLLVTCGGASQALAAVAAPSGSTALGPELELLEDTSGAMSADEVARSAAWARNTHGTPNYGFRRSAVWARFTVRAGVPQPLVLEAQYAPLDRIEVHVVGEPTRVTGDSVPFASRAFPFRYANILLAPHAGDTTYLVRISGTSSLQIALVLWSEAAYRAHIASDMTVQGAYVGLVVAMIVYNLFLAVAVRSLTYLFYSLFIVASGTFMASIEGLMFQFVFPQSTWLAAHAIPLSIAASGVFGTLFARRFLETHAHAPRIDLAVRVVFLTSVALGTASLVLEPQIGLRLLSVLAVAFSFVLLASAIARVAQGNRPARFFLIAWAVFLVGTISITLRLGGVLPTNGFTTYSQQIGSSLEVILLSLGLADRINALRDDAARAQRLALEEQTRTARELGKMADELRHQVTSRSRELTRLLARLEEPIPPIALAAGDTFEERYRVVRALGEGGMGAVYEVERSTDAQHFALKVVTRAITPTGAARMTREAEIGANLRHENLVAIIDVGVTATGAPFLVMELVNGGSLAERGERVASLESSLRALRQVASGLAVLHEAGVVHRDLKPGNILIGVDGVAKIADFGISRIDMPQIEVHGSARTLPVAEAAPSYLTATGAIVGTPQYMPPEAAEGGQTFGRAGDVFAFGLVAYELLAGRPAFAVPAIVLAVSGQPIPRPASVTLPDELTPLGELLATCLEADPAARPSAAQIRDLLQQCSVPQA
jgi:hypothetical protein